MIFFENNPKRRLAFAVVYFLCAFRFIIKDFVWSNLIVIIILLFVSYIILVKAKIIVNNEKEPESKADIALGLMPADSSERGAF